MPLKPLKLNDFVLPSSKAQRWQAREKKASREKSTIFRANIIVARVAITSREIL